MGNVQDDLEGTVGALPVCEHCGSECVVKDAWVRWDPPAGIWELDAVFDEAFCQDCERVITLAWRRDESAPPVSIRELNDQFRCDGRGNGSFVITGGVQAHGAAFIAQAARAVRAFDVFDEDNDPYGEHDFGAVTVGDEKIFWKIDYYDPTLNAGSENPADGDVTHRVLTIMLASEY